MRLRYPAIIALLILPLLVTAQENLGTYEDRIAVEDVMALCTSRTGKPCVATRTIR